MGRCRVVREREKGPQLPRTYENNKGGKRATVALRSPGLGSDIYMSSPKRRDSVCYAIKRVKSERGSERSEVLPATDRAASYAKVRRPDNE